MYHLENIFACCYCCCCYWSLVFDGLVSAKRHQNSLSTTEQCSTEQGMKRRKFCKDGTCCKREERGWRGAVWLGCCEIGRGLFMTFRLARFFLIDRRRSCGILTRHLSCCFLSRGVPVSTRICEYRTLSPKTSMTECWQRSDNLIG